MSKLNFTLLRGSFLNSDETSKHNSFELFVVSFTKSGEKKKNLYLNACDLNSVRQADQLEDILEMIKAKGADRVEITHKKECKTFNISDLLLGHSK